MPLEGGTVAHAAELLDVFCKEATAYVDREQQAATARKDHALAAANARRDTTLDRADAVHDYLTTLAVPALAYAQGISTAERKRGRGSFLVASASMEPTCASHVLALRCTLLTEKRGTKQYFCPKFFCQPIVSPTVGRKSLPAPVGQLPPGDWRPTVDCRSQNCTNAVSFW